MDLSLSTTQLSTEAYKCLKNTSILLSLTLLWSAVCGWGYVAAFGVVMNPVAAITLFITSFILLFALMAFRESYVGVILTFAFTGVMGCFMGPTVAHYAAISTMVVYTALAATAFIFVALSGLVLITKKDFGFMGNFLFIGLIGLLVVMILSLFINIGISQLAIAYFGALLFSGFIIFDTSEIVHGRETNYISATISMYLNLLNLFQFLLEIVFAFGGGDD